MTIRPGSPYGVPARLEPGTPLARSDLELRRLVEAFVDREEPPPVVGLLGGDLCRTLGGRGDLDRLRRGEGVEVPVDLGVIIADGERHHFVAHAIARQRRWHGRFAVVMNAQWFGDLDLGPRAHPGDALLDITQGRLGPRQRVMALRRARTGSHLPHRDLRSSRVREAEIAFDRATPVHIDGESVGRAEIIVVSVRPDAFRVMV